MEGGLQEEPVEYGVSMPSWQSEITLKSLITRKSKIMQIKTLQWLLEDKTQQHFQV